MATIFDYNSATDVMTITHQQDVSPYLKVAAELRADSNRTKKGIKKDWLHYAIIPQSVEMEMLTKHGVDCNKQADLPKVYKLLNDEYRQFKTTEIMHSVK